MTRATREVGDDHKLGWGEEFVAEEEARERIREQEESARLRQEEARRREAREKEDRRNRRKVLVKVPRRITRSDRNFAKKTNRRGQGKAHLVDTGLAPAGRTPIPASEQLDQDSPNKGTSNRISFTGPNPIEGGQQYGPEEAQQLTVKARKLMRARWKGKKDAQDLQVFTSSELSQEVASHPEVDKLRRFIRKDDEHQVLVQGPRWIIPNRFLIGPGGEETHDSDSESETELDDE